LPRELDDKETRKVNTKAAQPLIYRMHRLSPVGLTGNLADSIGTESRREVFGGVAVGPRRSGKYKGYVGHLVEFGTKLRLTKKSRAFRGAMRPRPFVEPAFKQTHDDVQKEMTKEYSRITTKLLKRLV
jgi:HK97 gp10 family phage protein